VVFLLVLDSTTQVTVTTDAYWWCELVLTFVWSIEYLLRLWSCVENSAIVPASDLRRCGVRVKAALHPLMLVDLVSLASLVIDLQIDSNQLRGFGALRMLRVFTLLRLERDWRICNPLIQVLVKESKLLGGAVAIALTLLVCVSDRSKLLVHGRVIAYAGTLRRAMRSVKVEASWHYTHACIDAVRALSTLVIMFYVEAPENPKFGSVADCLWWGTTALTTVGYGDLYPESPMGRLVASITAFLGIGLFALPAGIITTGFRLEEERRLHRKLSVPLDDGSPAGETEFQLELLRSIQRLERKLEGLEGKLQDVHGEIQSLRVERDRHKP
ncbi:kcnq1, partial [Symbiodinium sp. KB8]